MPRSTPEASISVSAATSPSTTLAGSKLRGTCHACASSKVRCSKQKPTCSRCVKRGTICEYSIAKRPGRRNENHSSERASPTTDAAQSLPDSSWTNVQPASSRINFTALPNLSQSSPIQNTCVGPSDAFSDLLSTEESSTSCLFSNVTADFDELFALPTPSSIQQRLNFDSSGRPRCTSNFADSSDQSNSNPTNASSFAVPEDTISVFGQHLSEFPNSQTQSSSSTKRRLSANDSQRYLEAEWSCCCLIRVLELMKQLSRTGLTPFTSQNEQEYGGSGNQLTTTKTIISKNKETLDAVGEMLQCSCSEDSYLLAILPLIIFKALDWYAAAAVGRTTPAAVGQETASQKSFPGEQQHQRKSRRSSVHSKRMPHRLQQSAVPATDELDSEDSGPTACQLVLSELHRIHRIVDQLSSRLKDYGQRKSRQTEPWGAGTIYLDWETSLPFPGIMLDQFERELRKRTQGLSLEIINMLRRY